MWGQKSQILSTETEKAFDTIQYAFVGKVLDKLVTNRMYLKIIEVIYNTHSQHVPQNNRGYIQQPQPVVCTETFPVKSGVR